MLLVGESVRLNVLKLKWKTMSSRRSRRSIFDEWMIEKSSSGQGKYSLSSAAPSASSPHLSVQLWYGKRHGRGNSSRLLFRFSPSHLWPSFRQLSLGYRLFFAFKVLIQKGVLGRGKRNGVKTFEGAESVSVHQWGVWVLKRGERGEKTGQESVQDIGVLRSSSRCSPGNNPRPLWAGDRSLTQHWARRNTGDKVSCGLERAIWIGVRTEKTIEKHRDLRSTVITGSEQGFSKIYDDLEHFFELARTRIGNELSQILNLSENPAGAGRKGRLKA